MIGYKGFDKDFKCRDMQYEVGKTYIEKEAKLCKKGLHFCENPLDVFTYYSPNDGKFAEIEADDVSPETGDDFYCHLLSLGKHHRLRFLQISRH